MEPCWVLLKASLDGKTQSTEKVATPSEVGEVWTWMWKDSVQAASAAFLLRCHDADVIIAFQ